MRNVMQLNSKSRQNWMSNLRTAIKMTTKKSFLFSDFSTKYMYMGKSCKWKLQEQKFEIKRLLYTNSTADK